MIRIDYLLRFWRKTSRLNFESTQDFVRLLSVTFMILTLSTALAPSNVSAKSTSAKSSKRRPASVPKTVSAEELFKTYSPAVVKIVVKQAGIPVSVGTGFFISNDGLLVTNHHVLRAAISSAEFSTEFVFSDKRVVTDYKVASCGDARGIDLCILKVNATPKSFFKLEKHESAPGEAVYVIGHPQGLDFSISNGIVSAVRKSPSGIDEVQISAPISPGNSGGPIFSGRGELVGVATNYVSGGQNLNFGIRVEEVIALSEMASTFFKPTDAYARFVTRIRGEMKMKGDQEIQPALRAAMKGELLQSALATSLLTTASSAHASNSSVSSAGLKDVTFEMADQTLVVRLPALFNSCSNVNSSGQVMHACYGMNDAAVFSIQRFALDRKSDLMKSHGKRLVDERALALVESLRQDGIWSEKEPKFSPQEKMSFYSKPSPAVCQKLRTKGVPGALFTGASACRFMVMDDNESGGFSVNLWVEREPYLYSFAVWMNDASLSEYFGQVPTLALLTTRLEGRLVDNGGAISGRRSLASSGTAKEDAPQPQQPSIKVSTAYELNLPGTMGYIQSQTSENGQIDFYGKKKPLDRFEDDYRLAVEVINQPVMPAKFNEASNEIASKIAARLSLKLNSKTKETEETTVNDRPSRLITVFGKNRTGQDVLVIASIIFDAERTFAIVQLSPSTDPSEHFKEFKAASSGFKRK